MSKLEFTLYKGKRILVEDFSNFKPGPEFFTQIQQAKKLIASQPAKSVLALFDASKTTFNSEMLDAMKQFTKENTPYIKAAAVVGISGLLQVALATVSRFSGRQFISFKSREEAMEWLTNQP